MKSLQSLFLLLFLSLAMVSCNDDDDNIPSGDGIIGEWRLIEQYADPGDGSGEFKPIESNRVLRFFENGTLTSNGSLCLPFSTTPGTYKGTYDLFQRRIFPEGCDTTIPDFYYSFELNDDELIVYFLCIEGCAQKYKKR